MSNRFDDGYEHDWPDEPAERPAYPAPDAGDWGEPGYRAAPSRPSAPRGYGQSAPRSRPSASGASGPAGYGTPSGPTSPYQGRQEYPRDAYPTFGQPGEMTQPAGYASGYDRPASPSRPYAGFDAPTVANQPVQDPWGPPSRSLAEWPSARQPWPGANAPYPVAGAAPKKRRAPGLLIGCLVVFALVLALAGGGVAYAIHQLGAPAATARAFCSDLTAQRYDAAYAQLGATLRARYTGAQFARLAGELDQAEGAVTSCAQATTGGYSYNLGESAATFKAVLLRPKQGALSGMLHLADEQGAWKVAAIDTSFFGVNLDSLRAADAFFTALKSQDYATAYGLLSADQQGQLPQSDYVSQQQLRDKLDGQVTGYTLLAIAHGANDTGATLSVRLTRGKADRPDGALTLATDGGAWKITGVTPATALGADLTPLTIGYRFCNDLKTRNFTDAYSLFSQRNLADISAQDFADEYGKVQWTACSIDTSTYKVSIAAASYVGALTASYKGRSATTKFKFGLVVENGAWKLDTAQKL